MRMVVPKLYSLAGPESWPVTADHDSVLTAGRGSAMMPPPRKGLASFRGSPLPRVFAIGITSNRIPLIVLSGMGLERRHSAPLSLQTEQVLIFAWLPGGVGRQGTRRSSRWIDTVACWPAGVWPLVLGTRCDSRGLPQHAERCSAGQALFDDGRQRLRRSASTRTPIPIPAWAAVCIGNGLTPSSPLPSGGSRDRGAGWSSPNYGTPGLPTTAHYGAPTSGSVRSASGRTRERQHRQSAIRIVEPDPAPIAIRLADRGQSRYLSRRDDLSSAT